MKNAFEITMLPVWSPTFEPVEWFKFPFCWIWCNVTG